jgi:transcriptional regulator GlxA family with amidase domain
MRDRTAPSRIGIVLYDGVEPIDLGGTLGVISMARRVLPHLADAVIARAAGRVVLAGGLVVDAPYGFRDAPPCDVTIICGGPGWEAAAGDPALLAFLQSRPAAQWASVCTGAMILAAAGCLEGRLATTRRHAAGQEDRAPLARLGAGGVQTRTALVVDDGIVTGGGVSLAIDTTLYDRAFAANRAALGIVGRMAGAA